MKKIVNMLTILCIALIIWIGVSFVDIVSDNNNPNPNHHEYNFFSVITEG